MKARKCEFCGEKLNKNSTFCKNCGNKVDNNKEVKEAVIDEGTKQSHFLLTIIVVLLAIIVGLGLYFIFFGN